MTLTFEILLILLILYVIYYDLMDALVMMMAVPDWQQRRTWQSLGEQLDAALNRPTSGQPDKQPVTNWSERDHIPVYLYR